MRFEPRRARVDAQPAGAVHVVDVVAAGAGVVGGERHREQAALIHGLAVVVDPHARAEVEQRPAQHAPAADEAGCGRSARPPPGRSGRRAGSRRAPARRRCRAARRGVRPRPPAPRGRARGAPGRRWRRASPATVPVPVVSLRETIDRDRRGAAGAVGGAGARQARAADLDAVGAVRGAVRAGLRGRLPGARPAAVPLRRADPERRDDARPLPRPGRFRAAGAVAGRAADRGAGSRRAADARCRPRRPGPARRSSTSSSRPTQHFHFFTAARYELLVPGAAPRVSGKIGFCMFDSFDIPGGAAKWFRPERAVVPQLGRRSRLRAHGALAAARPTATARSGSSSTSTSPALAPGAYRLRGVANPEGHLIEDDPSADVTRRQRVVPGVVGRARLCSCSRRRAGGGSTSARAVAPEIPARRAASCTPARGVRDLLRPDHGRLAADLRGRRQRRHTARPLRRRPADLRVRRRASSAPTR